MRAFHRLSDILPHNSLVSLILLAWCGFLAAGACECDPGDCGQIVPADDPELPARGFYTGTLPIPADDQELADAYAQASTAVDFVPIWGESVGADGFWDFADALAAPFGKTVIDEYTRGNGMFPLIQFSFMDRDSDTGDLILKLPPGISEATLEDPEWRAAYKNAVLDAVRSVKPLYLSTGNEVNRWYEQNGAGPGDPNGFQHFISLHGEIYDEVKAISPKTNVFFVLAREMVGELREARLDVLDQVDPTKLDLLVMTSYPYAVKLDSDGTPLEAPFNSPADIPDDYYSRVADAIPGLPVGFTEIGWPSTTFYGGEAGQADFIQEATGRLTADLPLHLLGWPWLHDLDENDELGLRYRDDGPKEAWAVFSTL